MAKKNFPNKAVAAQIIETPRGPWDAAFTMMEKKMEHDLKMQEAIMQQMGNQVNPFIQNPYMPPAAPQMPMQQMPMQPMPIAQMPMQQMPMQQQIMQQMTPEQQQIMQQAQADILAIQPAPAGAENPESGEVEKVNATAGAQILQIKPGEAKLISHLLTIIKGLEQATQEAHASRSEMRELFHTIRVLMENTQKMMVTGQVLMKQQRDFMTEQAIILETQGGFLKELRDEFIGPKDLPPPPLDPIESPNEAETVNS